MKTSPWLMLLCPVLGLGAAGCSSSESSTKDIWSLQFAFEDCTSEMIPDVTASLASEGENSGFTGCTAVAMHTGIGDHYVSVGLAPADSSGNSDAPGRGWLTLQFGMEMPEAGRSSSTLQPASAEDGSVDLFAKGTFANQVIRANYVDPATGQSATSVGGTIAVTSYNLEHLGEDRGQLRVNAHFDQVMFNTPSGTFSANGDMAITAMMQPATTGGGSNGGSNTGGGACSGSYQGPSADIQRDSQCMAAWSAMCAGQDPSAYCSLYNSFGPGNCPYC